MGRPLGGRRKEEAFEWNLTGSAGFRGRAGPAGDPVGQRLGGMTVHSSRLTEAFGDVVLRGEGRENIEIQCSEETWAD